MMRKFLLASLVLMTLMGTSCIKSIVSSAAKDSKVNNRMMLHSNPRVGDYAIFRGASSQVQMTMKIKSKRGGLYIVTSDTAFGVSGKYMTTLLLELHVTRSGYVKKAYVVESSGKTPLQIARKGDKEYMVMTRVTGSQLRAMKIPRRVTVPAGTYSVTPVVFKSKQDGQDVRTVHLVNKRVKFGMVAAYTYNYEGGKYDKLKSMELVEQGRKR